MKVSCRKSISSLRSSSTNWSNSMSLRSRDLNNDSRMRRSVTRVAPTIWLRSTKRSLGTSLTTMRMSWRWFKGSYLTQLRKTSRWLHTLKMKLAWDSSRSMRSKDTLARLKIHWTDSSILIRFRLSNYNWNSMLNVRSLRRRWIL